MRRLILALVVLAGVFALRPPAAYAECRWVWDCSGGACKHVPVCQHPGDFVPIEPVELPPIAPATVKPMEPPGMPPPGASTCAKRYICDDKGACAWRDICK